MSGRASGHKVRGKENIMDFENKEFNSNEDIVEVGLMFLDNRTYTYNGKRTNIAKLTVPTAQMAIEMYEKYFDAMYGNDETFTKAFDKIYEAYKSGIDIYLGCWCYPKPCHASIIAKKLQRKLIKEKMKTR